MLCRALLRQVVGAGVSQIRDSSRILTNSTKVQWRCFSKDPEKTFTIFLNAPSDHVPYTLSKEQEDLITKGNPECVVKLNELLLRMYVRKEQGSPLPDQVRKEDFEAMLDQSHTQLVKYMSYLLRRSSQLKATAKKKEASKVELQELWQTRAQSEYPWLDYHLHGNNLFPRVHKGSIQTFYNAYTAKGLQFGQKVIIDCSFEKYMGEKQLKHTAKQIIYSHVFNRKDRRPLGLHLCNFSKDGRLSYYLCKLHPQFYTDLPILTHSESYLDLFERKKLVYLTPHTTRSLQYNPNDIYIMGGIVDKEVGLDLTGKKAVKEEVRHACLPLGQLKWKLGSKLLCLHHCFNILLQVKNTGDWKRALLENVPERKLCSGNKERMENNRPSQRHYRSGL